MPTERSRRTGRGRAFWRKYQWFVVGAVAIASVGLGIDGFRRHFEATDEPWSWPRLIYLALQLFTVESGSLAPPDNLELDFARFIAPGVAVYVASRAIFAIFREELQLLRTRFWSDHVVVCGLGDRGVLLATGFKERGERVMAIERDEDADGVQRCREARIPVLIGDARDENVLYDARVPQARYLVAVGGDDGVNAEVAIDAGDLVADRVDGRLDAFVHLVDMRLCDLVRENETSVATSDSYRLRFFNVFESGMRTWLDEYPPFRDGSHLVVVGVGNMGSSLVVGAVRNWVMLHPETALEGKSGPRITLVDREAKLKRDRLELRHPKLKEFCKLDPQEMEVTWPEFEEAEFLFRRGRLTASMIYVCLDDDSLALKAGLTLLQLVEGSGVQVVVRMRRQAGLASLVDDTRGRGFQNLHAFGLLEKTCTPEFLLGETRTEILARAIHAEYRRDQEAQGETRETNAALAPWDELAEGLKESNRRQADHADVKLRAIGCEIVSQADRNGQPASFSEAEVELMAKMEHDRWTAERLFEGWTYRKGKKDLKRLTSPHLLGWSELKDDVQDWDRNTVRNLPEFLAEAGFWARRRT